MNLQDVLAQIEAELPGYSWLMRNDEPGRYFAHVYDEREGLNMNGYVVSSVAYSTSPQDALLTAFAEAKMLKEVAEDEATEPRP